MSQRINEDDLDYESGESCLYKNEPFTGIACEFYSDGAVRSEVEYQEGRQSGVASDYYANGAKKSVRHFENNELHGCTKEWFESGAQKSEGNYEFGIELDYVEWNVDGREVARRCIDEHSTQYQLLEKWRQTKR